MSRNRPLDIDCFAASEMPTAVQVVAEPDPFQSWLDDSRGCYLCLVFAALDWVDLGFFVGSTCDQAHKNRCTDNDYRVRPSYQKDHYCRNLTLEIEVDLLCRSHNYDAGNRRLHPRSPRRRRCFPDSYCSVHRSRTLVDITDCHMYATKFAVPVQICIALVPENLSDVISATSEASKLRHLAVKISVMGCKYKYLILLNLRITAPNALVACPTDILRHGWNGQDFSTLDSKLKDLIHPICMDIHTRNLYPILFNYHFLCRDNATRLQMAILDEVLTIFLHALETEAAPDCLILMTLRNGLSLYLQTVGDVAAISKSAQNPSATIDFDTLSAIGIPLIRNEEFQSFLLQDSDIIRRRKTWMALLESGTWTWDRIIS